MRYQYKMLSTALIESAQEMLCAITVDDDDHDEYHYHHHHHCKKLQIMTWDPAVKDKLERLSATLRKRSRAGEEIRRKTFIHHHHHTHTMRGKRHASLFRKNPSYSFCHSSFPPLPFCSSPLKILLGKALYGVDPAKLKFGTDSVHPCYWATFTNVLGLRERLYF